MAEPSTSRTALIGVSIPRSGHHYLVSLLARAFGPDLAYCEQYSSRRCCERMPCSEQPVCRVFLQKNHDLELAVDPRLPGVGYVVQYREPVPAMLSERELFAGVWGRERAADRADYEAFLAGRAAYYPRFFAKWVRNPGPASWVVPYARLLAEPEVTLGGLLRQFGIAVPEGAVAAAVCAVSAVRQASPLQRQPSAPFAARVVERSAYFEPELLAVYESLALASVPELDALRTFERVDPSDHPMQALCRIHGARFDGRRDLLERCARAALEQWPEHAFIALTAGRALLELRDGDAALAALERAAERLPGDAAAQLACADANLAAKRLERARELARGAVALVPEDASARLFHATVLQWCERPQEALEEALRAHELGIASQHLWRAFEAVIDGVRAAGWTLRAVPAPARACADV